MATHITAISLEALTAELTALRARCASLEAERDESSRAWRDSFDAMHQRAMSAEAMCADLAKALEQIAGEEPCHAGQIARKALAAYRKEAPDGPL